MNVSRRLTLRTAAVFAAAGVALTGCSSGPSSPSTNAANDSQSCITDFDADKDYFPDKVEPEFATNFKVEYHNSYKVVTVPSPTASDPEATYVLVQCGAPAPELSGDLAQAPQITVPVQRLGVTTAVQLSGIDMLDELDRVVGLADVDDVYSDDIRAKLTDKSAASFNNEAGELDVEKIVASEPDLVLQDGLSNPAWAKLDEVDVANVAASSYLETTPLGRAEWLKYYAVFLGDEAEANKLFTDIRDDYQEVKETIPADGTKPTVMIGTESKGTWTVPPKDNYVAGWVNDAGGDFVFSDLTDGTGTKKIDEETVLSKAADADIWINGNWISASRWKNNADLTAASPNAAKLKAVKDGQVWNPTKRIAANGRNDFWESGPMRPDIVLKDLAKVFHPDSFPDYELYYYHRLEG